MNTTVIVQRFFEYTLEFSKYERLDKGGRRPPTSLSCILLKTPSNNLLIQLVVTVFKHYAKGLGFPKYERLKKSIAEKHRRKDNLSCILQNKPRITLLVVIVFKYSVKGLSFPKYERLDKGGPSAPDKPLLYPLEKTPI